jgi:hypothetical protein
MAASMYTYVIMYSTFSMWQKAYNARRLRASGNPNWPRRFASIAYQWGYQEPAHTRYTTPSCT